MEKFSESSGLGISLEANSGHHYIRSVLPEGPVGRCGKLFSGDELVEVTSNRELVLPAVYQRRAACRRCLTATVGTPLRPLQRRLGHFVHILNNRSQVNGVSLIGETHKEVVRILKELPCSVYMTCCRPAPHQQQDIDAVQPDAEALSAMSKMKVRHFDQLNRAVD